MITLAVGLCCFGIAGLIGYWIGFRCGKIVK